MRQGVVALAISSLAGFASAGDFSLSTPIDCALGEDQPCYVQYYVDRADGPQIRDYTCSNLSYDGHKGTDFALRSHNQMAENIAVIAAADGRVVGVRDGMEDRVFLQAHSAEIDGRDCGNGVVLRHDDGWETQYCHLKKGSVQVRRGQQITRGDVLGHVGMSGRASFPHLHLSVRKDGQKTDPFLPSNGAVCGPAQERGLWQSEISYQPGGMISAGFAPDLPTYDAVKSGAAVHPTISQTAPAFVLWGLAFGTRPGDVLNLEITGPNGEEIHSKSVKLEKHQAQSFRAAGRRTQGAAWFKPGTYAGTSSLIRDGRTISDITVTVEVR